MQLAFSYQADDRAAAELRIHDLQTGEQITAWTDPDPEKQHPLPIHGLAWSPSGQYMAFSQGCCPLAPGYIWDLKASVLAGHRGVLGMFWGPDEDVLTLSVPQSVGKLIPVGSGDSSSIALVRPYVISPTVVLTGTAEVLYSPKAWLSKDELAYMQLNLSREGKEAEWAWWAAQIADGEIVDKRPLDAPPLPYDDNALEERLLPWLPGATFAEPVWSSDGAWVLFRAQVGTEEPDRIYAFRWEEGPLVGPIAEGTYLALAPVHTTWSCSH